MTTTSNTNSQPLQPLIDFSDYTTQQTGTQTATPEQDIFVQPIEPVSNNSLVRFSNPPSANSFRSANNAPSVFNQISTPAAGQPFDLLSDPIPQNALPEPVTLSEEAQIAEAIRRSLEDAPSVISEPEETANQITPYTGYEPSNALVPYQTAITPYGQAGPFFEAADYSEAPIEELAERFSNTADNSATQGTANLRPRGRLDQFQQEVRARVGSYLYNRGNIKALETAAKQTNGNADSDESNVERAEQRSVRSLHEQFDALKQSISSLKDELHYAKHNDKKKAIKKKLNQFTAQLDNIISEEKRLKATNDSSAFLDNGFAESRVMEDIEFAASNLVETLSEDIAELRRLHNAVYNLVSHGLTLEEHHDVINQAALNERADEIRAQFV